MPEGRDVRVIVKTLLVVAVLAGIVAVVVHVCVSRTSVTTEYA